MIEFRSPQTIMDFKDLLNSINFFIQNDPKCAPIHSAIEDLIEDIMLPDNHVIQKKCDHDFGGGFICKKCGEWKKR